MKNTFIIKGVPKWYSERDLLDYLKPQGVLHVKRLVRRVESPGKEWAAKPTNSIVLTFAPNSERPEKIDLGFTKHAVADFTEAPPRCLDANGLGTWPKFAQRIDAVSGAEATTTLKPAGQILLAPIAVAIIQRVSEAAPSV